MTTKLWLAGLLVIALGAPAGAQMLTRRADIVPGYDKDGKCTIEVDVDGSAEVEVSGDTGRIATLSGQPATWRRFLCSSPLPRDPSEFRFKGIDGRGRVQLVQDPRAARGRAVVRIDDTKSGREGYTFDLIWRGGSAAFGGGLRGDAYDRGSDRFERGRFGNTLGAWDREVDFRGRGDGYYRDNRGGNDRLGDCEVRINRRGDVRVSFETRRSYEITLSGRLTRNEGDRLIADMSGGNMAGSMVIEVDGDRVRQISMNGTGRDRFELRWRD